MTKFRSWEVPLHLTRLLKIATFLMIQLLTISNSSFSKTISASAIIEDGKGELNINDILKRCPKLSCASTTTKNRLNPGFQWLGFPIQKQLFDPDLFFSGPVKHQMTDFYFTNGTVVQKHIKGGTANRDRESRVFSLTESTKIFFNNQGETFLWIRAELELPQSNQYEIQSWKELNISNNRINSFKALYTGIVSSMILYNLFLYISTRLKIHLFYVAFILATFLPTLFGDFAPVFLSKELAQVSTYPIPFIGFFGLMFTHQFLKENLNSTLLRIDKYFLTGILAVIIVTFPLSSEFRIIFTQISTLIAGVWCISLTLYYTIKQPSFDKVIFLFAWLSFSIGVLFFGLEKNQLIVSNDYTRQAYRIGQILEVTLISLVLILRHKNTELESIALDKKNVSFSELIQALHNEVIRYHRIIKDTMENFNPNPGIDLKSKERVNRSLEALHQVAIQINQIKLKNSSSIELVKVSIEDVFQELKFLFEHRIEKKGIQFNFPVIAQNTQVWGSRAILIHQILSNLVSNAIKFSPQNSEIKFLITDKSDYLEIHLIDKGIGIPEEIMAKLFLTDQESNRAGTEGESGTGFGVPLANNFTSKLGGYLKVESRPAHLSEDHGTTFIIGLKRVKVIEAVA